MLKIIKQVVSILLSCLLYISIIPMRSFASAPPSATSSQRSNANQYYFELFSPNQELSVEKEKQIQIICKLYYGNQLITDWEQPGIAIGNANLISYIACEPVEGGYCITLQGKTEGTAILTLSDNTSSTSISVLVNVTDDSSACYNYILGQIPCGYPDSFWDREVLTNFYNFNGLYVTGLEKSVEPQDGVYHLNFKVYNTRYMHGSVDIYNENREWINSVRIDKNANVRGVWDVAKKGFFVLCDLAEWNGSYTSSLASTETIVNIEVPEGGYFVISNNFFASPAVYLYNGIDFAIYAANKTLDFTITSESIKGIQDKTIKQVLKSPEFLTVFQKSVTKNAAKMATDASGNVLTINLADSAGHITNEMISILDEVDINLWDVTASVTDVAVDVFVSFLPPQISQALDFMFTSSEVTDLLGQLDNIAKSYGKPYIEIYTPDACSTINVLEKSHGESDSLTDKRLTQVDVCFENGNSKQVKLNYNENGLLTGYTRDSYSSEHEYHYSYAYTYNADGNLTQSREILSGYPCTNYYYNDDGKLTSWEFWEFSWSSGKAYTCEYNASGQRIRDISTSGKDETLYFYDDLGRLVSISSRWVYGDMSGTDETTMTYDEYGNLSKKEILSDSGLGFPSMQTFIYNYDYFPFVHVTVYRGGELMYSCLEYNAMSADERVSFTIDNTAKFESEEGYLVKVKGEDCEWNFSYMQENTLPVLGVSDSENQAGEENTSLRVIREASVGDYVTYGAYEQDNDLTNGQEPIEWLVLDREGDRVLLLSRFGLDAQPYNTVNMDVTWEKSSIRSWLNETFLRNAFSVEEQQFILKTNVDNSKSQGYYAWSTSGGNGTQDKIFLLSYSEANKFLGVTDSARENIISQVLPTDYAKARGAYSGAYPPDSDKTDSAVIGWWWLRSPGFKQYAALCVNVGGSVSFYSEVGKTAGCIRPAFWISIK